MSYEVWMRKPGGKWWLFSTHQTRSQATDMVRKQRQIDERPPRFRHQYEVRETKKPVPMKSNN